MENNRVRTLTALDIAKVNSCFGKVFSTNNYFLTGLGTSRLAGKRWQTFSFSCLKFVLELPIGAILLSILRKNQ